jgi:predicted HTH domain antitoxin
MQVIEIRELQTKPDKFTKTLSRKDCALITQQDQAIGVALPFSEDLLSNDLKPWYALKAFQSGDLSFGQLSKSFGKSHHETISLLGFLGVPIADYDLEEDLRAIDEIESNS